MSSTSSFHAGTERHQAPPIGGTAEAPLSAWLHRSLCRQYDAVLSEELPPALIALAREAAGEH